MISPFTFLIPLSEIAAIKSEMIPRYELAPALLVPKDGSPLPTMYKFPFKTPSSIAPEYSNCVIHLKFSPKRFIAVSVVKSFVVEAGINEAFSL